jgi:hypothetical protein
MLNVNKLGGYSISILGNSNKILSSTKENLSGLVPGTLIKIGDSDILYPIQSTKNIYYLKNFEVLDGRKIIINEDTEINIQIEDDIKIFYEEYELDYLFDIENKGIYYKVGDVINVKGGELSIDIKDGMGEPTKFIVEEIGEAGSIEKLSLKDKGRYISFPDGKAETWGGAGQNCILNLKYKIVNNRSVEEKIVKNIEFKEGKTILTLDYSLPLNLQKGSLSLEKSEVLLAVDYNGKTARNCSFKIIKDFSQHYSLPLTVKGNLDFHLVYNNLVHRIDKELKFLNDKIDKLEKLISS